MRHLAAPVTPGTGSPSGAAVPRASEAELRKIAHLLPQCIWSALSDGRHDYFSPRWHEYTGVPYEAGAGDEWHGVVHRDDLAETERRWRRSLASGEPYEVEHRCRRHDGAYRWFLTRAVPVRDEAGEIVRWIGTSTDVHEAKQLEDALQEADRRKNASLARLSHELRNPLGVIRCAVDLLTAAAAGNERVAHASAVIGRQLTQVTSLVDDLLDVTRVARGKLELQPTRLDLAELVRHTVEDQAPLLAARRLAVEVRLAAGPFPVDADPNRTSQALANLLQNSAKFTDPGGRVVVELLRDGSTAVVRVEDSGVGIAPEILPRVFEPFTQADESRRRSGGLGLGLALVKGIVELEGGAVEARSDGPGRGAELTIRLPLAPGAFVAPEPDPGATLGAVLKSPAGPPPLGGAAPGR